MALATGAHPFSIQPPRQQLQQNIDMVECYTCGGDHFARECPRSGCGSSGDKKGSSKGRDEKGRGKGSDEKGSGKSSAGPHRWAAELAKFSGQATKHDLNPLRRGTVELDTDCTQGYNTWVRYPRDDGKMAWISQTELAQALQRMEDDQASWLEGEPSDQVIMDQDGVKISLQKQAQGRDAWIAARKAEEAEAVALAQKSAAAAKTSRKKRKADSDDPLDPSSQYFMDPELISWFTDNLPHRWQGIRTWAQMVDAAKTGLARAVSCPAEGCERVWHIREDVDEASALGSLWAHLNSRADREDDWELDDKQHGTHQFLQQLQACYKRMQLADMEKEREEAGMIEGPDGARALNPDAPGSAWSDWHEKIRKPAVPASDKTTWAAPATLGVQAGFRWATSGGWGGRAVHHW